MRAIRSSSVDWALTSPAFANDAPGARISTMMYARDTNGAVYPGSGIRDGFHTASHHSNARARMDSFAQINRSHVQMLGYFLEKLRATPDGDGNLLEHSVVDDRKHWTNPLRGRR